MGVHLTMSNISILLLFQLFSAILAGSFFEDLNPFDDPIQTCCDVLEGRLIELENTISHQSDTISSLKSDVRVNEVNIGKNTGSIDTNSINIGTNEDIIGTNSDNIDVNSDYISTNTGAISNNKKATESNSQAIASLENSAYVGVCAYMDKTGSTGTITYDSISSSYITDSSALSTSSGIYTASTSGFYMVTWSTDTNYAADIYLYKQGVMMEDMLYRSYAGSGDYDMGSRTVMVQLCPEE